MVPMPKAAMNENDTSESPENQIRTARKTLPVKPVPVSHPVDHAPHREFGLSILRSHASHDH